MNFDAVKNFMDRLTADVVPGNSAVIYKDNKKVFEYSSGYSDMENKIEMNGTELLNIYSCSKVATVTAALQLFEQGRFLLSDPLYEYIPEFKDMTVQAENGEIIKAENPITIQNLFTMAAGFSYNFELPAFEKARKITNGKMDTVKVIKCLAEEPLLFEPGTHWNYSVCHDVLAAMVEVISGKKFRDYVKENIFDALNMNESYYHVTPEIESRMAEQYRHDVTEQDIVKLQQSKQTETGVVRNIGKGVAHILGEEYDSGGAGIGIRDLNRMGFKSLMPRQMC